MLVADRGRRPHQNPYPAPRSPPRLPVHREHRRQLRAREIARIAGARSARQCRPCPPGPERGAARLERKRKPARGVQRRRPGTHTIQKHDPAPHDSHERCTGGRGGRSALDSSAPSACLQYKDKRGGGGGQDARSGKDHGTHALHKITHGKL